MSDRNEVPDRTEAPSPAATFEVGTVSSAARLLYRAVRALAVLLTKLVWRVEVEGRERLPAGVPYVVAPVHRSYVDFLVVAVAVPRLMRFMVKDSVWKARRLGQLLEWAGSFPVDRGNADRQALRNAERAIAGGDPVVMFPEGRRQEGPEVTELFDGAAWVACRNRVPIVPIGLGHTDDAMPIGAKFIRFAKVKVVIGEPIFPDVPLTGRVPRRVVSETTRRLRDEIQRCYDQVR